MSDTPPTEPTYAEAKASYDAYNAVLTAAGLLSNPPFENVPAITLAAWKAAVAAARGQTAPATLDPQQALDQQGINRVVDGPMAPAPAS